MRKKLIDEISKRLKIPQHELVEKDIILHEIMTDLSKSDYFVKNYIFKGGTCLTKCYLGYYRFSEDMDFTWKNQKMFDEKSTSQLRRDLSEIISKTGQIVEGIASKRDLDFKCKKSDREYVELGGSNKRCTFKIWYVSEITKNKTYVKLQINYVEKLCFPSKSGKLSSLVKTDVQELSLLFSEHHEYFETINFDIYDQNEILCEKVRAILTRQATKARDYLDVYKVCEKFDIDITNLEKEIMIKLESSLEMNERYKEFIKQKAIQIESGNLFEWGDEQDLLLEKIDDEKFYSFNKKFEKFLNKIIPDQYHSLMYKLPISAVCSGGDGANNTPHNISISNPGGMSFDEIDFTKEKCPQCGLVGTIQAFPF